jgi:hypothetical protein
MVPLTHSGQLVWYSPLEKVYFSSLNFYESPIFLHQLQNWTNHLPQLFKLYILPLWSGFE